MNIIDEYGVIALSEKESFRSGHLKSNDDKFQRLRLSGHLRLIWQTVRRSVMIESNAGDDDGIQEEEEDLVEEGRLFLPNRQTDMADC